MESQLLSAGILLPINEYWDNYPNIKNGRDEATWDLMRYTDGNIYSIGIKNPNPLSIIAYRQDWLDKLGLEVPTTLDEYYKVATAVAKEDPDGNGVDDTFAFGGYQNVDTSWFDHIFGAYGALPNYWMLQNIFLHWDWGTSAKMRPNVPVFEILRDRIPITLQRFLLEWQQVSLQQSRKIPLSIIWFL